MVFDFLSLAILLVLTTIAITLIKVLIETQKVKKESFFNQKLLQERFAEAYEKNKLNMHKLNLVDNLHESLFKRLFKITREILLLQKLMLDEQS